MRDSQKVDAVLRGLLICCMVVLDCRSVRLCNRATVFSIEGQAVGAEYLGWMGSGDWIPAMRSIDPVAHPLVHVTIDGAASTLWRILSFT